MNFLNLYLIKGLYLFISKYGKRNEVFNYIIYFKKNNNIKIVI